MMKRWSPAYLSDLTWSKLVTRVEPISINELYGQLLSYESRQVLLQGGNGPSTNTAMHGRGGFQHERVDNTRGCTGGRNATTPSRTTTTIVAHQTTMVSVLFARSTRRKGTRWYNVGTVLMRAMDPREGLLLRLPIPMEWIQIGTPTQMPHIISQVSLRSWT
jgi:hypothetical protein